MPDFLIPELAALRAAAETLIAELDDISTQERAEATGDDSVAGDGTAGDRVRQRSRELGLYGLTQPSELGGTGAGPLALTVVRETLAAANHSLTRYALGPRPGILGEARGNLRARYLQPLLSGKKRGAFAFTEPPDAKQPTSAVREGDDLIINGRKAYVTGGADADFYMTLVNVRAPDPANAGTAMLVVDRSSPGLTLAEEFRSLEGGHHVSLVFENVRAPIANVIGKIGEGLPRALRNISDVRLAMAAESTGLAIWTIDFTTERLRQPHRSGSPLGEHEAIRLRFADMRIETYAARSMLYRTARLADAGENVINEVMATKIFATEMVGRVVDGAVQLFGGQALIQGHPLEKLYRRVRSMRLAEGASDLLRLNLSKGRLELDKGRL